jgi:hypothetical protein
VKFLAGVIIGAVATVAVLVAIDIRDERAR